MNKSDSQSSLINMSSFLHYSRDELLKICRVCGKPCDLKKSISALNDDMLRENLSTHLQVNITENSNLPHHVCHHCSTKIIDWDFLVKTSGVLERLLSKLHEANRFDIDNTAGVCTTSAGEIPIKIPSGKNSSENSVQNKRPVTKTQNKLGAKKKSLVNNSKKGPQNKIKSLRSSNQFLNKSNRKLCPEKRSVGRPHGKKKARNICVQEKETPNGHNTFIIGKSPQAQFKEQTSKDSSPQCQFDEQNSKDSSPQPKLEEQTSKDLSLPQPKLEEQTSKDSSPNKDSQMPRSCEKTQIMLATSTIEGPTETVSMATQQKADSALLSVNESSDMEIKPDPEPQSELPHYAFDAQLTVKEEPENHDDDFPQKSKESQNLPQNHSVQKPGDDCKIENHTNMCQNSNYSTSNIHKVSQITFNLTKKSDFEQVNKFPQLRISLEKLKIPNKNQEVTKNIIQNETEIITNKLIKEIKIALENKNNNLNQNCCICNQSTVEFINHLKHNHDTNTIVKQLLDEFKLNNIEHNMSSIIMDRASKTRSIVKLYLNKILMLLPENVREIIKNDDILNSYGLYLVEKYAESNLTLFQFVANKLQEMVNLLLKCRQRNPELTNIASILINENCMLIYKSIQEMCNFNVEKNTYEKPDVVNSIVYSIKECSRILSELDLKYKYNYYFDFIQSFNMLFKNDVEINKDSKILHNRKRKLEV